MSEVQKIGLGTAQFGSQYGISNQLGKPDIQEVKQILKLASRYKIRIIDTARAYGDSEKVIGLSGVNGFSLVSKFILDKDFQTVESQLRESLTNLNRSCLYGYLAHRPLQLVQREGAWEELKLLQRQGLIQRIGFSLNCPGELKQLLSDGIIPDLVQLPYNYFDRRFESAIKKLKIYGCEIHARSVFLQGLFFADQSDLPQFFDEIKPTILELQQTIGNLSASLLAFVRNHPLIDHIIVGVENHTQLMQNLKEPDRPDLLPELRINIPENILMPSCWPKK